jgi:hypothetical protein
MDSTLLIKVTNEKAFGLLHELEELHLIKVLRKNIDQHPVKLSEKYKGVFTHQEAEDFNKHTQKLRSEWQGS